MDPLCYFFLVLLCFNQRLFVDALWSPVGKGLTSWLSFVMSNCDVVTFPIGMGQVWCMIVSISDLCPLSYFVKWIVFTFTIRLNYFTICITHLCISHTMTHEIMTNKYRRRQE